MTSAQLLADLAELGYPVSSVDELRESHRRYGPAVPALLRALAESNDHREKQSLVRALSVPWAKKEALDPLIAEFRSVPADGGPQADSLRWSIGNALEVLWDDKRFDDLVDLVRDGRFGRAREMIALGLARSKRPEAGDVLIELLDDPIVSGHAVKALAKLKITRARPGLERMTRDPRAWVRRAAIAALAAMDSTS